MVKIMTIYLQKTKKRRRKGKEYKERTKGADLWPEEE